jgi:phosphomannomutase / phosphoglucomutase
MSDHVFREYDIRGVAERDLTDDLATRIGFGLSQKLKPSSGATPHLVVARDCRLSSPRLHAALLRGLVAGGAQVTDVGVGPTPLMYFGVHHLQADGGIMITGSHNPAEDNGFKIMIGKASFWGQAIQELRDFVKMAQVPSASTGSVTSLDITDDYVARLSGGVTIAPENLPIVVDAGNGSAGPLGTRVLRTVGFNPVELFCDMDGRFPNHHPDPTVPKNLTALIERVRKEKARVGIAWDGDGDRLGVVDATGEIVWGDRLLILFARPALAANPGAAVVGDVKCSQVLFDEIQRSGGRPIMWKTGHSVIKTKMKEEHALMAGEMSGHFFFADRYYGYDDAIYAALRLLEVLSSTGKTVLELLSSLPATHSTPELRVECPDAIKFELVERVKHELSPLGSLSTIDGARLTYADGAWALVRASNTGPVVVLRFEAPSEARLQQIRSQVEAVVSKTRRALEGNAGH